MILEKESDIRSTIEQIDRCFNILIPKPEDVFNDFGISQSSLNKNNDDNSDTDDDDNFETVIIPGCENDDTEEELRYLGFLKGRDSEYSRNFELNININKIDNNEDNRILIEILRDLYKEIKYSHLDSLSNWIKVNSCLFLCFVCHIFFFI